MAKKTENNDAKVVREPNSRRQQRAERWLRRKKIRTGEIQSQAVVRSKERQQKEREEKRAEQRVERERVSKALYDAEIKLIHKEYLIRKECVNDKDELRHSPFKDVLVGLSDEG